MKKVILIITTLMFISCSTDNNSEKENSFNMKESNTNDFSREKLSNDSNFIELVIEKVKAGEEVTFENVEEKEER